MRIQSLSFLLLLLAGPVPAFAGDQPVVVELYTSQGCSACPPADDLLSKLADHEDILPLALHVDYWDYIGWKDRFADPAFTRRQKGYARAAEQRSIYTPQMVVDGVDHVVGYKPMQVMELVQKHKDRPDLIPLKASRRGAEVRITAEPNADLSGPAVVQLIRYVPERIVDIEHGENAGHTFRYSNVVVEWRALGVWDMAEPLRIDADLSEGPAAVILQRPHQGAILAAMRID